LENCTPSARLQLSRWAQSGNGDTGASLASNLASKMSEGVIDLDLNLLDDSVYPEIPNFLKGNKLRIPGIYANYEKMEKIIELAGGKKSDLKKQEK
jgi:hypothetical protein